jgi:sec-independent protein translocase protein TatA
MVAALDGTPLIILLVVLVVVFGGSQLPKLARNLGSAGKEFRKAQEEAEADAAAKDAAKTPTVVVAPQPIAASSDDRVTMSKADLNALLDEREARAKSDPASS